MNTRVSRGAGSQYRCHRVKFWSWWDIHVLVVCWNIKGQAGIGAQAGGEVLFLRHLCVIHPHHCAGALCGVDVSFSWAQGLYA